MESYIDYEDGSSYSLVNEDTNPESEERDYPDEDELGDWYADEDEGYYSGNSGFDLENVDFLYTKIIDAYETIADYMVQFECPICYEIKEEGYATDCEHVFCKSCLEKWLVCNKVCPYCRKCIF
jgi:hypothetical protein